MPADPPPLVLIASITTVLVSATLLFLMQPMFARMMLPLLGGSPAVWNTSMVFYQVALLAGYGYAHLTTRWLGVRRQALLHVGLVVSALLFLPIAVPHGARPPTEHNPILWLLGTLSLAIGLPFFVVSSTGPLIQRWFAASRHPSASDPYFLYAASNSGSMGGLLAYPFLIEPRLKLADQSRLWTWGYGLLALLLVTCALLLRRVTVTGAASSRLADEPGPNASGLRSIAARLTRRRRMRWLLLAFVPSSLMMAVTTHITTDVAAIPLLWVVPLALYLLTFILMFLPRPPIPLDASAQLLPVLIIPLLLVLVGQPAQIYVILGVHLLFLLVVGLMCHGQLARDRPEPEHLTVFYLWLAAGGALGGVFNALVAPLVFRSVAEYPIVIVLACALLPAGTWRKVGARQRWLDVILPAIVAAVAWSIVRVFQVLDVEFIRPLQVLLVALLVIPVITFTSRPLRFALGVGALLLTNPAELERHARMLHSERSFFGVSRVLLDPSRSYHNLFHGSTLHGVERVRPLRCREPLGYYGRSGPLGDVFRARRSHTSQLSVAVLGLGAGGTIAYAEPGDHWVFYEIDPAVSRIANDTRLFCFLAAAPIRPQIILGDARLSLASARDSYDLMLLDAYSSDAIPVHLLTREALGVYLDHLAPGGVLVFHISNKFFDLAPVVAKLAQDAGLTCRIRAHEVLTSEEMVSGMLPATYAVLARGAEDLKTLAPEREWRAGFVGAGTPLWRDDFSSLFAALRRN